MTDATHAGGTLGRRAHALLAGVPRTSLVLGLAVPPLFLHATYQPHVSVALAGTSVDVTLADVAIAMVVVAAALRVRADGAGPLRSARWVLAAAVALVGLAVLSLAIPGLRGEEYAVASHVVSALKFAWYATLLPATVLLVRSVAEARPLLAGIVCWSAVATVVGALQFVGLVSEFEGKRPGQREPSIVGIHDFAALSGAALLVGLAGVALGSRRPLPASWTAPAISAGGLGVVLSGALTGVAGIWLAVAVLVLLARSLGRTPTRRDVALIAAVALVVTAGTAFMRATAIERFAEFLGLRDRDDTTQVESYAHRTLLAYIGVRIWLDHPLVGVGWQASSEEWAYAPHLDDARSRFPDEPDEAFPSPERPWGVQTLYVQIAADLGLVGVAALLALFTAAVSTAARGARASPIPVVGLCWLLVAAGVWAGIGLVPGLPLDALAWLALGLVASRG